MRAESGNFYSEAKKVFCEEIRALENGLSSIETGFNQAVEKMLQTPGRVVVTGLGKSGHIAQKISATLASTGTPSLYINGSEALHGDLGMVASGDLVIMISKSGSTLELVKMFPELKHLQVPVIGLFGDLSTELARKCDLVINVGVKSEACPLNLAPMSSTTLALVTGDAIAAALMKARGFKKEDFAAFHPGGQLGRGLLLKVHDVMQRRDQVGVLSPKASIKEVVMALTQFPQGAVCVEREGEFISIVTDGDVRRYLVDHEDLSASAENIMAEKPVTIASDLTLSQALDLMERETRKIYVLPVVNSKKKLLGLLRMHDIVNG